MFYVYCYRHPETKVPFYIGKGSRNRAWIHLNPANRRKSHFHNTITKIEKETGLSPIVEIVQDKLDEDSAYALEIQLIKKYGRIHYGGGTLTNVEPGGNGPTKYSRDKISQSLSGRVFSEEHRVNLSMARKSQKIPPKARIWNLLSPDGIYFKVVNLKQFCVDNNLNYDDLKHNVKGKKAVGRGASAGWKAISATPYLLSTQLSAS